MNHTYRSVFNASLGAWVAAPETARAKGKSGRAKLLSAAVLSALTFNAHALPTGGQVSAGSGTVSQSGSAMTVNQTSQNLAINWQSFGIGANETVNFSQPNASAIALNRVLGSDPSQILGQLNANGQVWILNPNGVLFGKGAQVNVGGLVASTLDLSDADFLAGKRTFAGNGGSVTNEGEINAAYVALLGEQAKNEGVIAANLGTVALAAGNKVTLDFNGDRLLNVQIDEGALHALAENKALIQADGGLVVMTAKAKDALLDTAVNNSGVIQARTIENRAGRILLLDDMDSGTVNVGGTLDASAPGTGDGGFVETSAAHVKIADSARVTTLAANGNGGAWLIDPYDFTIAASGGDITGAALGAALGSTDVTVQTLAGSVNCTGAACGSGNSGGNGDIFVRDDVTWTSGNTLTLSAYRNIEILATLDASGGSGGKVALEYGQGASATGNTATYSFGLTGSGFTGKINLQAGQNFSTKLGSDGTAINYTVITALGSQTDKDSAGHYTLQGLAHNSNFTGNFVLGADIDATDTWDTDTWALPGFWPIGTSGAPFDGRFDGLGHTILGLTTRAAGTMHYVGMFGATGSNAVVGNVGLTSIVYPSMMMAGSVSGTDYVGRLVGYNNGTIFQSYATGDVSGDSYVGGLAGYNNGTITQSYATGDVSGNNGDSVGGLAGYNNGTITQSYATGDVSGELRVGGLVGYSGGGGTITQSYATGAVGGSSSVGGLAGYSYGTIAQSYATGAVSGSSSVGGLAGGSSGTITESYATGDVSGSFFVGGLAGGSSGTITESYATGDVSGSLYVGGLVGLNLGTVTASYWDTQTSGQVSSDGGTGKTTAEMKQLATFADAGWNIDDAGGTGTVWRIYDGSTSPLLRFFLTPLTVTANDATKTYNGLAYSGGNGVSYSVSPNGNLLGAATYGGSSQGAVNVGSYAITPGGFYSNQQGYDIAYANGVLTIVASVAPTVPGAPADGYTGAIVSASGGITSSAAGSSATGGGAAGDAPAPETALLAAAAGAADAGLPGLSVIPCGQNLPQGMDCR